MEASAGDRSPEPSDIIWDWRGLASSGADGGVFSCPAFQAGIVALAACFLGWQGHLLTAQILAGVAALVLILGLLFPSGHAKLFFALRFAGLKIGEGFSLFLLVPFYFLIFTPLSLWLRIAGKDFLKKNFPSEQTSCWEARPEAPSDPQSYKRQF